MSFRIYTDAIFRSLRVRPHLTFESIHLIVSLTTQSNTVLNTSFGRAKIWNLNIQPLPFRSRSNNHAYSIDFQSIRKLNRPIFQINYICHWSPITSPLLLLFQTYFFLTICKLSPHTIEVQVSKYNDRVLLLPHHLRNPWLHNKIPSLEVSGPTCQVHIWAQYQEISKIQDFTREVHQAPR